MMKLIDRIRRELARILRRLEPSRNGEDTPEAATAPEAPATPAEGREEPPQTPTEEPQTPDAPAERVEWRFGGFDGSRAVEDSRVQVGSVKMGRDRMTFKWTKGDLSAWGLAREEAGAIACFFFLDGSRWVGGKADWISTSRTSRDFKNIEAGYHGWDSKAFFGASRRAFCVVSKDGKRRTNIAEDWA